MWRYLNVLRENTSAGLSRNTMAFPVDVRSVKRPVHANPSLAEVDTANCGVRKTIVRPTTAIVRPAIINKDSIKQKHPLYAVLKGSCDHATESTVSRDSIVCTFICSAIDKTRFTLV